MVYVTVPTAFANFLDHEKGSRKVLRNADSQLPEDMSFVSIVVRICNVRNTLICFASLVNNADLAVNFTPINSFP